MLTYLGNTPILNATYLGSTNIPENNINHINQLDIVRNGLLFAFDWTSFNENGTLTDRSINNRNATYSGSLSVSSSALYFDGKSAVFFQTGSYYKPWEWTVQSYGDYYPYTSSAGVNAPTGALSYGWNQIATAISTPLQTDATWNFIIQVSGSSNYLWWQTARIGAVDPQKNIITGSLNNVSLAATGTQRIISNNTGSEIRTYYNNSELPKSYFDSLPTRNFSNEPNQYFGVYSFNDGVIDYYWNALSGSMKYILYYDRPLSPAEITQNNNFFKLNEPIRY